jgi:lipopolysaccharide transport system ATP-binding protein
VDEVLAVGDAMFQKKCLGKMQDVGKGGRTVLFVSHNMDAIMRLCSRGILLQKGGVANSGSVRDVVNHYTSTHATQPMTVSLTRLVSPEYVRQNVVLLKAEWPKSSSSAPWTIPFGKPLTFTISFECRKAVRHIELGIGLFAASGIELASTSSIVTQPELNLDSGTYKFQVTYHSLKLVPGNYTFSVGLKSDAGFEDHFLQAFSVDILPSDESSLARTDTFLGYLIPDVAYELIPS